MNWKSQLLLGLGIIGVVDTIGVIIIDGGINLGVILPAIIGFCLIYYSLIIANIVSYPDLLDNKLLKKLAAIIFIVFLISFILIETLIFTAANDQLDQPCDYLIILGGGVKGTEATLALEERLKRSIQYINKQPQIKKIIVTGGQGVQAELPEADVMKDFLVEHDVNADKIIREDKASSTNENFKFSKEILTELEVTSQDQITIVTSEFHLWRAKFLAARNGISVKGISAETPYYILPNLALREYFAIIKSYIWDR